MEKNDGVDDRIKGPGNFKHFYLDGCLQLRICVAHGPNHGRSRRMTKMALIPGTRWGDRNEKTDGFPPILGRREEITEH